MSLRLVSGCIRGLVFPSHFSSSSSSSSSCAFSSSSSASSSSSLFSSSFFPSSAFSRPRLVRFSPRSLLSSSLLLSCGHCRHMSIKSPSEVKIGTLVVHEGGLYRVLLNSVNAAGRAHTTYTLELREFNATSGKTIVKFGSSTKVHVADVENSQLSFLYRLSDQFVVFMDPATFEQLEVHIDAVGAQHVFLVEGMIYRVEIYNGSVVRVHIPDKVVMTVANTDPPSKMKGEAARKDCVLTNGVRVSVPLFVGIGDHLVIRSANSEYVSKSTETPEQVLAEAVKINENNRAAAQQKKN